MKITERDAHLMICALYRAEDWTAESITCLRGCTCAEDRREIAKERRARGKYRRLRDRLERKLGEPKEPRP